METTPVAKVEKPKPSSASVEFIEDSVVVDFNPKAEDFIKSASGRQSTAHYVYKPAENVTDFAGRSVQQVKISYIVNEAQYLKEKEEKAKKQVFRLFAAAFRKLTDVKMIERFAAGEIRLKAKLNDKKTTAYLSVSDNDEGFLLSDLPSAANLPPEERMKDGKPVQLAFEKVMDFLDQRDRKVKLDISALQKNIQLCQDQRDKFKKESEEWAAWERMRADNEKTMKRQLALQNKVAKEKGVQPSAIAPSDALNQALDEQAEKLGITKEARKLL